MTRTPVRLPAVCVAAAFAGGCGSPAGGRLEAARGPGPRRDRTPVHGPERGREGGARGAGPGSRDAGSGGLVKVRPWRRDGHRGWLIVDGPGSFAFEMRSRLIPGHGPGFIP